MHRLVRSGPGRHQSGQRRDQRRGRDLGAAGGPAGGGWCIERGGQERGQARAAQHRKTLTYPPGRPGEHSVTQPLVPIGPTPVVSG